MAPFWYVAQKASEKRISCKNTHTHTQPANTKVLPVIRSVVPSNVVKSATNCTYLKFSIKIHFLFYCNTF